MYAKEEQTIRAFSGRIIGKIYTMYNGDKEARDFYGKCIGRYNKARNVTTDFYGRVIAHGDAISMLFNLNSKWGNIWNLID